jgi:hypothetical protein
MGKRGTLFTNCYGTVAANSWSHSSATVGPRLSVMATDPV